MHDQYTVDTLIHPYLLGLSCIINWLMSTPPYIISTNVQVCSCLSHSRMETVTVSLAVFVNTEVMNLVERLQPA